MRLIDAEPIEKYIEDGLNSKDELKRFGHDAIEIMTEIHYAPTAVVLCKDCIHYGDVGDCEVHPHDGRFNVNYFCADGEKKA